MSSPDLISASRLETMIANVLDPETNMWIKARFLCDGGSNKSFTEKKKEEDLNLPTIDVQKIGIQAFGRPVDIRERKLLRLLVSFDENPTAHDLEVPIIAVPEMCDYVSSHKLTEQQLEYIDSNKLTLSDIAATKDDLLKIDFLIGQDYYHQFVRGNKHYAPDGLVLTECRNGYILGGSVKSRRNNVNESSVSMFVHSDNTYARNQPN